MNSGPSLRARLFAAIVFVAIGVLALSSVATYVLVRRSIAANALDDLRERSSALAEQGNQLAGAVPANPGTQRQQPADQRLRRTAIRNQARQTLNVSDFKVVFINAAGQLVTGEQFTDSADVIGLPPELSPTDLDTAALVAGNEQSGTKGDTVFLALAVGEARGLTTVVVATDSIDSSVLSDSQPLLLAAAIATFLLAATIAAWVARRLTRPIAEIERAARALAAGDLSARAKIGNGTDQELAALANTLNAMARQLESARGSERAFLLSISHDLRTPLTSIRGYAEALADGTIDGSDPQARGRAAEIITAESRRLERLVRDLLDLSRLDTHQFTLTPRPCDAAGVVRDAAEAFAPAAREHGLTLVVETSSSIAADLDADRLAQIVANLVENALKYARSSVVVTTAVLGSGQFRLSVADDGPGVPDAELAHVFERLYTVRSTPARAVGTGLGLAIVRELAATMGGVAGAEPAGTGGTRFLVTMPLGAAALAR